MATIMIRHTLLAASLLAAGAQAAPTQIDVLALYTPSTTARYGGAPLTRLNHLVSVTNQIFADSGVNAQLRLVHAAEVKYPESNSSEQALPAMASHSHAAFAGVAALRDRVGADLVVLYRPYSSGHGSCGLGYVGGHKKNGDFSGATERESGYSHVAVNICGDYVTAHEIGHNLGLLHSRRQDGQGGTFPYALGHGEYGVFTTIMAYQAAFNVPIVDGKVWKFASPQLDCKGRPCGVDRNDVTHGADAVYTLNITAPQVADYSPQKLPNDINAIASQQSLGLYGQLVKAQQLQVSANARLASAQGQLNSFISANQSTLDSAKAIYEAAADKAKQAYSDMQLAYQAFRTSGGSTSQRQELYNSYLRLRTAYNNDNAALRAAAAPLRPYLALVNRVKSAQSATDSAAAMISKIQASLRTLESSIGLTSQV